MTAFKTDLNGRGARERIKNSRSSYDFDVVEADGEVAGNYYPITSSISITDKSTDDSLTILADRGQAGGSLESGQIDIMLHRRLTNRRATGDRFLGEILNEGIYLQYTNLPCTLSGDPKYPEVRYLKNGLQIKNELVSLEMVLW